jgi:hypothetical protein
VQEIPIEPALFMNMSVLRLHKGSEDHSMSSNSILFLKYTLPLLASRTPLSVGYTHTNTVQAHGETQCKTLNGFAVRMMYFKLSAYYTMQNLIPQAWSEGTRFDFLPGGRVSYQDYSNIMQYL